MLFPWAVVFVLQLGQAAGFINVPIPNASWFFKNGLFLSNKVDGYSAALYSALDSFSGGDGVQKLSSEPPTRWVASMSTMSSSVLNPSEGDGDGGDGDDNAKTIPADHYVQAMTALRSAGLEWVGEPRVSELSAGFCNWVYKVELDVLPKASGDSTQEGSSRSSSSADSSNAAADVDFWSSSETLEQAQRQVVATAAAVVKRARSALGDTLGGSLGDTFKRGEGNFLDDFLAQWGQGKPAATTKANGQGGAAAAARGEGLTPLEESNAVKSFSDADESSPLAAAFVAVLEACAPSPSRGQATRSQAFVVKIFSDLAKIRQEPRHRGVVDQVAADLGLAPRVIASTPDLIVHEWVPGRELGEKDLAAAAAADPAATQPQTTTPPPPLTDKRGNPPLSNLETLAARPDDDDSAVSNGNAQQQQLDGVEDSETDLTRYGALDMAATLAFVAVGAAANVARGAADGLTDFGVLDRELSEKVKQRLFTLQAQAKALKRERRQARQQQQQGGEQKPPPPPLPPPSLSPQSIQTGTQTRLPRGPVPPSPRRLGASIAAKLALLHSQPFPPAFINDTDPILWTSTTKMLQHIAKRPELLPDGFTMALLESECSEARLKLKQLPMLKVVVGHGDFKPTNIMMGESNGGEPQVQFIDFELAGPNYRGFDIFKLFRRGQPQPQLQQSKNGNLNSNLNGSGSSGSLESQGGDAGLANLVNRQDRLQLQRSEDALLLKSFVETYLAALPAEPPRGVPGGSSGGGGSGGGGGGGGGAGVWTTRKRTTTASKYTATGDVLATAAAASVSPSSPSPPPPPPVEEPQSTLEQLIANQKTKKGEAAAARGEEGAMSAAQLDGDEDSVSTEAAALAVIAAAGGAAAAEVAADAAAEAAAEAAAAFAGVCAVEQDPLSVEGSAPSEGVSVPSPQASNPSTLSSAPLGPSPVSSPSQASQASSFQASSSQASQALSAGLTLEAVLAEVSLFEPLTWLEAAVFFLFAIQEDPSNSEKWAALARHRWSNYLESKPRLETGAQRLKELHGAFNQPVATAAASAAAAAEVEATTQSSSKKGDEREEGLTADSTRGSPDVTFDSTCGNGSSNTQGDGDDRSQQLIRPPPPLFDALADDSRPLLSRDNAESGLGAVGSEGNIAG